MGFVSRQLGKEEDRHPVAVCQQYLQCSFGVCSSVLAHRSPSVPERSRVSFVVFYGEP